MTETIRRVKASVPAIQRKMQLYLANRETEFILFRPIRCSSCHQMQSSRREKDMVGGAYYCRSDILTAFVTLLSVLRAEYTLEEQVLKAFCSLTHVHNQGMVGCPSQEQLAAILASVMVVTVAR